MNNAFFARPFAHRALHDRTHQENSLGAIEAAVQKGWAIEVDVQLSKCGRAMVFHDYDLARLSNGKGPIQGLNLEALKALPLKDGSKIPTLEEALAVIQGKVPVVVEIKDQDGAMGPNVGTLERAVAKALGAYNGPSACMSFNPHSVRKMAELMPDLLRGLVTSSYQPDDWPLLPESRRAELREMPIELAKANFISHEAKSLHLPRVAQIRDTMPVLCWTIKSAAQEATARQFADQVTFEGYTPKT